MKRWLVVLLVMLSLLACSSDNEEKKREHAAELVELMDMKKLFDNMYQQIEALMKKQTAQVEIEPQEKPIVDAYYARMIVVIQEEMAWDKMKGPVAQVYMDNFSADEIAGMVEFYSSEVGQATIRRLPTVMRESTLLGRELAKGYLPKIQFLARQLDAELNQARGITNPTAAAPQDASNQTQLAQTPTAASQTQQPQAGKDQASPSAVDQKANDQEFVDQVLGSQESAQQDAGSAKKEPIVKKLEPSNVN